MFKDILFIFIYYLFIMCREKCTVHFITAYNSEIYIAAVINQNYERYIQLAYSTFEKDY